MLRGSARRPARLAGVFVYYRPPVLVAAVRSVATYVVVSLYVFVTGLVGMLLATVFGWTDVLYIFGHGGCFGDDGHCEVPTGPRRPNDLRPQHQLTPMDVRVVATDPLRAASERPDGSKLTVTVVPVIEPEDAADYKNTDLLNDPLLIQHASVITYA